MNDPISPRGTAPAPAERLSVEEETVWRSLGRVVQRLPRTVDSIMLRSTGLTMTEFSVLDALRDNPQHTLRISDLAAVTGLSASRVSRVVDSMATRGWCRRERDATDGRAALAKLTEEGLATAGTASAFHVEVAREYVLAHVPAEARHAFITVLAAIAEHAGETR
ncbi:MarR family winged helix-turn-helix transcriptional regulator [Streptomyces sp. NPDC017991]|uniref:MarR family winged helix-turn-helix transcriptional regulator n=1 Tax=Streptomyces sp. NPDC017991 TaxID=3365026 RepID=UPI00379A6F31